MGGVLHHARVMCAIINPTVNSYKRINAPVTARGARRLPLYPIDAIRAFERYQALRVALGEDFSKI